MGQHRLVEYIEGVATAHQGQFRTMSSGQINPYFTHPLWAAMMILLEPDLPEKVRLNGSLALLFHDLLEDTSEPLPKDLPVEVVKWVKKMTLPKTAEYNFSGFEYEKVHLLDSPLEIQLLKLYDKVASLYDGAVAPERHQAWCDLTRKLIINVEKKYGNLRICMLGRELIK